jgi:hypothetical protein
VDLFVVDDDDIRALDHDEPLVERVHVPPFSASTSARQRHLSTQRRYVNATHRRHERNVGPSTHERKNART